MATELNVETRTGVPKFTFAAAKFGKTRGGLNGGIQSKGANPGSKADAEGPGVLRVACS